MRQQSCRISKKSVASVILLRVIGQLVEQRERGVLCSWKSGVISGKCLED